MRNTLESSVRFPSHCEEGQAKPSASPLKKAVALRGPVPADELGIVLPHEHILLNPRLDPEAGSQSRYPELWDRKVTMDILGALHRDESCCRDNRILDDPQLAVQELLSFKRTGGLTLADATVVGLGRAPRALYDIAEQTGLNVIIGAGYYLAWSHPPYLEEMSVDAIADWMVRELEEGVDDTRLRAGMIGELGTGSPVHPREEKVLRAGCRAHAQTGAPIEIHLSGHGVELPRVHAILQEEHVDPCWVVMLHMDDGVTQDLQFKAADWGYYVSLDCFGIERYLDRTLETQPRDTDRIQYIVDLVARGHLDQILVSQDVWLKMCLKHYGGWGYDHLLVNIVPRMIHSGISKEQIAQIMVHNPAKVLAYSS